MEFVVTARKWRPVRFSEVIGQDHITQTLKNAVLMNRIHHAYLFCGPRGVGKTTTARILARVVNCENPSDGEPCNQCESCLSVLEARSLDVIEIDGASNNSVDDIRLLRENAKYPPIRGKYKIYIIDEVHMLSTSAFNALLKILEEPPKHLIFIFATTEPHKVIPTIVSRCQRFDFHRIEVSTIVEQISKIAKAEGIDIDEMSLFSIAKKADGSLRDAQSIFDQFVASSGKIIRFENVKELLHIIDADYFFKVSSAYHQRDSKLSFQISDDLARNGYDYTEFISGLLEHFRNIFFVKITGETWKLNVPLDLQKRYLEEANKFNEKDLIRIMNLISTVEQQFKFSTLPRIRLELLLTQIIEMPSVFEIEDLISEIRALREITPLQHQTKQNLGKKTEETNRKDDTQSDSEMQKWSQFLEKYKSKLNGLKLFYESHMLEVEFRTKQIILIAINGLVFDNLNTKKRAIRQAIKEFFGNEYDFELIQSDKPIQQSQPVREEFSPEMKFNQPAASDVKNETTIEETLKRLFGAREIPLP